MSNLNQQQITEILDFFGKIVIEHARDLVLELYMEYATGNSINPIEREKYQVLSSLTNEQYESVCNLLSETITSTIFHFLDMFEAYSKDMRLLVTKDGIEYDLNKISDKMGCEIASIDEDGWIQKFSKVGRPPV